MNVLHISNDFAGSKVHSNLIKQLDLLGINQTVYCPVRTLEAIGKNSFDGNATTIRYSYIIKSYYRWFYHYKRHVLYNDMRNLIDLRKFNLVHAATLFSDGGLAYCMWKEFGIPYVVAVRNTDINDFAKLPHLWRDGQKILLYAQMIYFISAAPMEEFKTLCFVRPILEKISHKMKLRPNGIDDYWRNNISFEQRIGNRILYIGDYSPNKNVARLIAAIKKLRNEYSLPLELSVVGGGKDIKGLVSAEIKANSDFVKEYGPIYDKEVLCSIMRDHSVFAMPSIHETFGLVYMEALSQNLPVIYSRNQGIDGLFDSKSLPVGLGVDPQSVDSIAAALLSILENHSAYSNRQVDFNVFDWSAIAQKYLLDYSQIIQ